MLTASIVLSIFISVIFAIIYASNDAEIVKNRLYVGIKKPLAKNTRLTLRAMFSVWLALMHYLVVINISPLTGIGLLLILFAISFLSFHCVFDVALNIFLDRLWHSLGSTSNTDNLWTEIEKEKPGKVSLIVESILLIAAICLLAYLYN